MVPFGFRIACRRASWPTRRSPCGVNATTEGVVRAPSAFGITVVWPPCVAAITELVVPRSIPTATAITASCFLTANAQACPRALPASWADPGARGKSCSAGDLDLARLGGLGLRYGHGQDAVRELRGDRVGVDVAGQVGPELELASATRAAVAAATVAVLGLGDLAANDQLAVLKLDVDLVLVHAGQFSLDHVGVVGFGQVCGRNPGHAGQGGGGQAEREIHQLAHTVVDILELAGRIDDGGGPSAAPDRERCHWVPPVAGT